MALAYYLCSYRLHESAGYLIWFTDEEGGVEDGVVTSPEALLQIFRSQSDAEIQARNLNILLSEENPAFYDMTVISDWVDTPAAETVDCSAFDNAWNMFGDIALSTGSAFDADRTQTRRIYQKLFWGCNLPSVTPPGQRYGPLWDTEEIEALAVCRRELATSIP